MTSRIGTTHLRVFLPLLAVAWALGGLAEAGRAQQVSGVVRDSDGRRLGGARVELRHPDAGVVDVTESDPEGRFRLSAPLPGSYAIRILRLSYRTLLGGPYALRTGETLEVAAVMHIEAMEMDSLQVSAGREVLRLAAVGFYERRDRGIGHFLEREDFQRAGVTQVSDALRRVPGVSVREPAADDMLHPRLEFTRGIGNCSPTIVIDGVEVHRGSISGGPARPDEWLVPEDVEAAEIYLGPGPAPIEQMFRSSCGLVMFWSHHTPVDWRRGGAPGR